MKNRDRTNVCVFVYYLIAILSPNIDSTFIILGYVHSDRSSEMSTQWENERQSKRALIRMKDGNIVRQTQ